MNFQSGYSTPVFGILCDGSTFHFFKFSGGRTRSAEPQFFCGEFPNGAKEQQIPLALRSSNVEVLYSQARALCESLYYVLLLAYNIGLEAHFNRSIDRPKAKGKGRESIPKWQNAVSLSKEALRLALLAETEWQNKEIEKSKGSAEKAVQLITKRYV
jgi:hypothetical protein